MESTVCALDEGLETRPRPRPRLGAAGAKTEELLLESDEKPVSWPLISLFARDVGAGSSMIDPLVDELSVDTGVGAADTSAGGFTDSRPRPRPFGGFDDAIRGESRAANDSATTKTSRLYAGESSMFPHWEFLVRLSLSVLRLLIGFCLNRGREHKQTLRPSSERDILPLTGTNQCLDDTSGFYSNITVQKEALWCI